MGVAVRRHAAVIQEALNRRAARSGLQRQSDAPLSRPAIEGFFYDNGGNNSGGIRPETGFL